ncbi:MAG: tetratricopeptide repeat protein [Bryobacterales bacterium]|nr:tetratricopeptide repeat protein [Bryobacterales bacterium]
MATSWFQRGRRAAGLMTLLAASAPLPGQQQQQQPAVDRGKSYFHYSMGHLYAELAGAYGNRGEYLNKAIDNYRLAMKSDAEATFIADRLADLYLQAGRVREGITDAEALLRDNPKDLNARRVLGRIYLRLVGDSQQGRVNEQMVTKAIEQYTKITEESPKEIESWLNLGRLQRVAQNSVDAEKAFKKAVEIDEENEDALTGLAMLYSDRGDAKAAADLLSKVASKSPNLRTLMGLAGAYEQMREHTLAAETLRRALQFAKGNDEIRRALAQNLMLAEKNDEALKEYEELLAEDPRDVQSLLRTSQLYRQMRRFDKAREYSDRAKKLEPTNLEITYNEVGIYQAEGKTAEAIEALKKVVDATQRRTYSAGEKQNRASLLERLGFLYRINEQYKEAAGVFHDLGALDPAFGAASSAQVIDTWRLAHDFPKATEEAEAAIKKYPEDRAIRAARANLLADTGKFDQATAELKKLLDGKNDRDTYMQLVQVHEKAKNYGEMSKAIDAAEGLSTTPDEKEMVHFMRGAMLEKTKKFDQAEAEFRKLLALNPTSTSALNYLGYMMADRGVRVSEALEMIKKALEQDPNNGAYLDSLGWAYFKLGKLTEAEQSLRRAQERTPKDPTIHDHLGDVLAKQGNLKGAITEWEASVRLHQQAPPFEQDPQETAKIGKKLEGARVRLAKEQQGKK